jgi:hypothetical protein
MPIVADFGPDVQEYADYGKQRGGCRGMSRTWQLPALPGCSLLSAPHHHAFTRFETYTPGKIAATMQYNTALTVDSFG